MTMAKIEPTSISVADGIEGILEVRQTWIANKEADLSTAEQALASYKAMGAPKPKLTSLKRRVALLRRTVNALKRGFIPMPRFDGNTLSLDMVDMPVKALVAVQEARASKLFSELRIVQGVEPTSTGSWGRRGGRTRRDPFVVGVVREAAVIAPNPWGRMEEYQRPLEEHFLVAWWRPEDMRPEDLF